MGTAYKNIMGWRPALDMHVFGITKRAREQGNSTYLRSVAAHLQTLARRLDELAGGMPSVKHLTKPVKESLADIKPLLDENPEMTLAELIERSGRAYATCSKYRALYRKARGLPPLKAGRKPLNRAALNAAIKELL
jgi:hypothetical protein